MAAFFAVLGAGAGQLEYDVVEQPADESRRSPRSMSFSLRLRGQFDLRARVSAGSRRRRPPAARRASGMQGMDDGELFARFTKQVQRNLHIAPGLERAPYDRRPNCVVQVDLVAVGRPPHIRGVHRQAAS